MKKRAYAKKRTCTSCGDCKPIEEFYLRSDGSVNGRACRACVCIRSTERERRNMAARGQRRIQVLNLWAAGERDREQIAAKLGTTLGAIHSIINRLVEKGEIDLPPDHDSREMVGLDLIPCARCGLRGHELGDPARCLHGDATAGLGSSASWAEMTAGTAGEQ